MFWSDMLTPSAPVSSLGRPSFASLLKLHKDLSAQERKATIAQASPSESSTDHAVRPLCRDFLSGRGCGRGGKCKFSHERPPKPVCRDFQNGRCWRGPKCRYDHLARVPAQPQSQERQPPPPPQLLPPGTHTELISSTAFASAPTSGLAHPSLATPAAVAQPAAPAAMACADKHANSDSGAPSPSRRAPAPSDFA